MKNKKKTDETGQTSAKARIVDPCGEGIPKKKKGWEFGETAGRGETSSNRATGIGLSGNDCSRFGRPTRSQSNRGKNHE